MMLDIDDFKAVNDNYGHQQGDIVLREVAKSCAPPRARSTSPRATAARSSRSCSRARIWRARTTSPSACARGSRRCVPILGDESAEPLRVTASFGSPRRCGPAGDVRGLVAAADEALYQAKRAGKNKSVRAR